MTEITLKGDVIRCRGCLNTEQLYDMHQHNLAESFRLIIGEQIDMRDGLPQHLCYICRFLLLKCMDFRERCHQAKNIFLTVKNKMVIQPIPHPYMYTHTNVEQYLYTLELATSQSIENKMSEEHDVSIKVESEFDTKIDDISIKSEDEKCLEEFVVDQPLTEKIKRNVRSVKRIKNVKRLKAIRKNLDDTKRRSGRITKSKKSDTLIDTNAHIVSEIDAKPQKFKQKGKYFETKENMTNFEKCYDVDIVVLSKEQQMLDIINRKRGFDYPYRCEDCFKGFMDNDNLIKHAKALHDTSRGDAVCDVCKSRYKDKRDLNRHLKTHRLKFACRQCKYTSRNTSKAVEHYKMHGGQLYKCDHCGKAYEKQSTYLTHIRISHPSELIWCDICGESFISDFGLNGHKKLAHKELKLPPDCKCTHCEAQFINADALKRHTRLSHEISANMSRDMCDATCVHCGDNFDTRLLFKDHLLENHRNTNSKSYYPCVKCNKVFPKRNLYSAHYRRVHVDSETGNPKPIICELCGKALPNKCELKYHQRVHTGERPFKCPECPKSFIKRAFVKTHMRVHSNDRPFACKLCPKTFKGPAALSGHQYVHTGIKPPVRRKKRPQFTLESVN